MICIYVFWLLRIERNGLVICARNVSVPITAGGLMGQGAVVVVPDNA